MWQKSERTISAVAILGAFLLLAASAVAQSGTVTLQEQLAAQYKLAKLGSDSNGVSVTDAGTLLEIKKGGILGVPYGDASVATKYQDGAVHSPNALMMQGRGSLLVTDTDSSEHPGFKVRVADTVGSGDAFTAGLVHEYLHGASLDLMNEVANLVGAWVASEVGAMPAPKRGALEHSLAEIR